MERRENVGGKVEDFEDLTDFNDNLQVVKKIEIKKDSKCSRWDTEGTRALRQGRARERERRWWREGQREREWVEDWTSTEHGPDTAVDSLPHHLFLRGRKLWNYFSQIALPSGFYEIWKAKYREKQKQMADMKFPVAAEQAPFGASGCWEQG